MVPHFIDSEDKDDSCRLVVVFPDASFVPTPLLFVKYATPHFLDH